MPRTKSSQSNRTFSERKSSVTSQKNNFSYKSLYLWTSFLLGMISLGIVLWQRRQEFFSAAVIPSHLSEIPRYTRDDKVFTRSDSFIVTYSTPLILSALTYQQTSNSFASLFVGLSNYLDITTAQFSPALTVNLDNLNLTQAIIFSGGQYAGYSLYATDVNSDGHVDLLIGAYGVNKAYLVYGPTFNISNLDNLSGQQGVVFAGGTDTGLRVYAADVNGDRNVDILIGSYASKIYLVYGPNFANATALDNLNMQQGVIFTGSGGGYSIYSTDVNNDGHVDILIGTDGSKVYLIYGPNFANATGLDSLSGQKGLVFIGGAGTGASVYATDINNDTHVDLLMGAYYDDASSGVNKVYLVYGPNFYNATALDNLSREKGVVFNGGVGTGFFVYAKDVNGDGWLDLLISALRAEKAYVVYGPNFSNATALDSLTAQQGLIFTGGGGPVYAEDMNNDGNLDLAIGAWAVNKVYLVYGPNFSNATALDSLSLQQGIILTGGSYTGISLYVSDVNSDGCSDILTSAYYVNKPYLVLNQAFATCLPKTTPAPTTTTATIISTTNPSTFLQTKSSTISSLETLPLISTTTSQTATNQPTATTTAIASIIPAGENTSPAPEKNNTPLYAGIGGGLGGLAVLLGGVGLFACYQKNNKKKKEQQNKNNVISLAAKENISISSVVTAQENNSDRTASARLNYNRLDEVKKPDQQYDTPTKLEI
jgi:hypothetical protein